MLVLTRKAGERIVINNNVVVEVLEVMGNRVRIGIQAPDGVTILRKELLLREKPDARQESGARPGTEAVLS
jgi:carbon storage regulator